jgi:hypothetical protein
MSRDLGQLLFIKDDAHYALLDVSAQGPSWHLLAMQYRDRCVSTPPVAPGHIRNPACGEHEHCVAGGDVGDYMRWTSGST